VTQASRPDTHPAEEEWNLPGTLATMAELAYSGLAILQELLQAPVHQVQDWLASDQGPLSSLVAQFRDQWDRLQRDLGRQLEALDRTRALLEERLVRGLDEMRSEQRSTVRRIERVVIRPASAPAPSTKPSRAKSSSAKRSTAKKSTATKSTAKRTTARTSAAKKPTAKKSAAKKSAAVRRTSSGR
jgi:hypothetical protein